MIIIFSIINDGTTNEVANWLKYYNVQYKIVYSDEFLATVGITNFSATNISAYIEKKLGSSINEISVIWCRKWSSRIHPVQTISNSFDFESKYSLAESCLKETRKVSELLFSFLPQNKMINDFYERNRSKLFQLLKAQSIGISIPKTHILSKRKDVQNVLSNNGGLTLITKAMDETFSISYDLSLFTGLTTRLRMEKVSSESFIPSLIQEEIKKKYEIRTFVLDQKLFSIAIFSQGNKQTEVDFRRYDQTNPNKTVQYELPLGLKEKILKLFKELNLKLGSVDIIVNEKGEYIFLEINPYGQFGMVSKNGTYNLEKKVAEYLINYGRKS